MITYAERECLRPAHLRLLFRVETLVARVSDSWGNELRCHELARAVFHVVGAHELTVIDGHCGLVEHSWLCFPDGTILDAYVPGRLPAVQVVDPLVGIMYRPGPARDDVRQSIVDQLVVEMMRGAPLTTADVIEAAARYFALKPADLRSARRSRAVATVRSVAMYLARSCTRDSFNDVARAFGGRHHTTVLAAVRRIEAQVRDDAALRDQVAAIERQLRR